ncbi:MAG: UDP-N-acetylmuramoyl-tripeptide--D-alanyl-D-alanine ligase [Pseudomonadota bacterium]
MTPLWTAEDAQAATGGTGPGGWAATGVSIDTRTLAPGDLFVALTDRRDGHDFVAAALKAGAAAALVSRVPKGVAEDAPLLRVEDTLAALRALGAAARARTRAQVIAVTGSVGKTGTKEMLRTALTPQGRVHASDRSYNNHWGVPLTLARMPAATDFAVIEIGMNAPGEIAPLSALTRPHVALVTNVSAVHIAAFRSVRAIAHEKALIFSGLAPGGAAILNRDSATYPSQLRIARRHAARLVRFGATGRPELRLVEARAGDHSTTIDARVEGRPLLFKLGAPGRHLALNALGALAAIGAAGGDITRAAVGLASWRAPEGRGARWRISLGDAALDGEILLIDESYNANPASMEAALEGLAAASTKDDVGRVAKGRRVAFLGDMLELGTDEVAFHRDLAGLSALREIDRVHCAGALMRHLHAALPPACQGQWFETAEDLAAEARRLVDAGDVTMVKGSNGSRISRVVDAIRELGDARPVRGSEETG